MTELLKELGCEVIGLNIEQSGRFAHPPEPIPEHLVLLLVQASPLHSASVPLTSGYVLVILGRSLRYSKSGEGGLGRSC